MECGLNKLTYKEIWGALKLGSETIEKCQKERLINHSPGKKGIATLPHSYASYHPNS